MSNITIRFLLKLILPTLILVPVLCLASLPVGITVSVTPVKAKYSAQDPLLFSVRYTNTTDQNIQILKWNTALEGRVNSDIFSITSQFGVLPYVGRQYKRAAPRGSDYVVLAPGLYEEAIVDIYDAYILDSKGEYLIQYKAGPDGARKLGTMTNFRLNEDRLITAFKRAPTFENCVGGRPSEIDSAVSASESIARRARDDLQQTPRGSRANAQRYREWFGVYAEGRWNTVQDHFNRIYSALSGRILNFICDDTTGAFAYVYPSQPYNIYLGRAFWSAPRTGTDSKAGTIIHELSHFTILGDTDDVVYGQSGARSLANNNPNNAVRNADSHEYFAENTPFLSMPKSADLVIASATISDSNPRANRPVAIAGTIANQGAGGSTTTSLSLRLQGPSNIPQITLIAIPPIVQGASFNFQLDFTAPSVTGEYSASLCISAFDGESNTNNNCSVLPPLIVTRVVIAPIIDLILQEEPTP